MSKLNTEWKVQPHGPLVQAGDGIWTVAGSIVMPLGEFPRRMTVIALEGGGVAVWSAIALDDAEMARLDALGPVKFLIVPNQAHRLDLAAWKTRYPAARIIAPPSARKDVEEAAPVDATDDIIKDSAITLERTAGTKADEFALVITKSDGTTLVLNDILSNVRHPHGLGANIMARVLGFGVKRPRTSRPVRRMFVNEPTAVAQQFRAWAQLPNLVRIIVSHGDIITENPRSALETAADDY